MCTGTMSNKSVGKLKRKGAIRCHRSKSVNSEKPSADSFPGNTLSVAVRDQRRESLPIFVEDRKASMDQEAPSEAGSSNLLEPDEDHLDVVSIHTPGSDADASSSEDEGAETTKKPPSTIDEEKKLDASMADVPEEIRTHLVDRAYRFICDVHADDEDECHYSPLDTEQLSSLNESSVGGVLGEENIHQQLDRLSVRRRERSGSDLSVDSVNEGLTEEEEVSFSQLSDNPHPKGQPRKRAGVAHPVPTVSKLGTSDTDEDEEAVLGAREKVVNQQTRSLQAPLVDEGALTETEIMSGADDEADDESEMPKKMADSNV